MNTNHQAVRTRFAPSPTGVLHLGNARTAYYNWLCARRHGGQFYIRIEDTDAERNSYEQLPELLKMLEWLGLNHDNLSYQSHNKKRHAAVVEMLENTGHAYRCYMTREELELQRSEHGCITSPWRDNTNITPPDKDYVVRFRMPHDQECVVDDRVRGRVRVDSSTLDDMVLSRSDGMPTYVLACVVDDHDSCITHIIRGDEHLTNAFRQSMIYRALGWEVPTFAHIPLVCDMEGNKLSKRVSSQNIAHFQEAGYLPEAVLNAVLRTGWSCGDSEIIPVARALETFDLSGINKAAARFDPEKLRHLNGHYIRSMPVERLWSHLEPRLPEWPEEDRRRALSLLEETAKRHSTIAELVSALQYCRADFAINHNELDPDVMRKIYDTLKNIGNFDKESVERVLREFATTNNLHFGRQVASPLRIAITGTNASPCLFHVISSLGKEIVLSRVMAQCQK